MKIHLISDVHMEISSVLHKAPGGADVVVLAGDIGEYTDGLKWAIKTFPNHPIIYVPGNHEYYRNDIGDYHEIKREATRLGIYFLDNESIEIKGVRFLGCTLWTDFKKWSPIEVDNARSLMNDYRKITAIKWLLDDGNKRKLNYLINKLNEQPINDDSFRPEIAYLLHLNSKAWLKSQLEIPFRGKTVVVTHHAPCYQAIAHETNDKKIKLSSSYASDLTSIINNYGCYINIWLHGHIHRPMTYYVKGVKVTTNPRGYPVVGGEAYSTKGGILDDFKAKLLIEI